MLYYYSTPCLVPELAIGVYIEALIIISYLKDHQVSTIKLKPLLSIEDVYIDNEHPLSRLVLVQELEVKNTHPAWIGTLSESQLNF